MKKIIEEYHYCFEIGDLCRNQFGGMYVITEVKNGAYKFINLQDTKIEVIGDTIHVHKGEISEQSSRIFDKYNYLYQPNK